MREKAREENERGWPWLSLIGTGLASAVPGLSFNSLLTPYGTERRIVDIIYGRRGWLARFLLPLTVLVLFGLAFCAFSIPVYEMRTNLSLGFLILVIGLTIGGLSDSLFTAARGFVRRDEFKNEKAKPGFGILALIIGVGTFAALCFGLGDISSSLSIDEGGATTYLGLTLGALLLALSAFCPGFSGIALMPLGLHQFLDITFNTALRGTGEKSSYIVAICLFAALFTLFFFLFGLLKGWARKKVSGLDSYLSCFGSAFTAATLIYYVVTSWDRYYSSFTASTSQEKGALVWIYLAMGVAGLAVGLVPLFANLFRYHILKPVVLSNEKGATPYPGEDYRPAFDARTDLRYESADSVAPAVATPVIPDIKPDDADATERLDEVLNGGEIPSEHKEEPAKDKQPSAPADRQLSEDEKMLEDILGGR